jgi:hypothetical protein
VDIRIVLDLLSAYQVLYQLAKVLAAYVVVDINIE